MAFGEIKTVFGESKIAFAESKLEVTIARKVLPQNHVYREALFL